MKRNIYSKKMFVADLVVTSVWALFTLRYSLWGAWPALFYILMRVALCFEMRRRSPWTLVSGLAFILCYAGFAFRDVATYPVRRLVYYVGAALGDGSNVVRAFGEGLDHDSMVWIYIAVSLVNLWLMALPVAVGFVMNNIRSISWRHKWIWIYLGIALLLSVWAALDEPVAGTFVLGLMLGVLPVVYWSLYDRKGRSLVALLAGDRAVTLYIQFVMLFSLCLFLGLDGSGFLKAVGLIIMPPLFYLLICRGCRYRPLTRHAAALALCGLLFYFIMSAPWELKIVTLSLSFLLALYVAVDVIRIRHDISVGCVMFLMPLVMVAPVVLGLNPYAAPDVDSVSLCHDGYYGPDGTFVTEKDGRYGLRDRFGVILRPGYRKFTRLDKWGRYVSINLEDPKLFEDERCGLYDIVRRQFLLDPESVEVSRVNRTGENRFELISPDGKHFATLLLRGYHPERGCYIRETTIEYVGKKQ